MPRVHRYKTQARRGGKPNHRCSACGKDIEPGQDRYEWEFRYGGARRRHVTCGYPKRSELTMSNMSQVYAAIEAVETAWGESKEEISTSLTSIAEAAEEVKSMYEEAAENFGGAGPNAERAEELESLVSDVESAASEIDGEEPEEGESEEDFIQRLRDKAEEALSQCP